MYHTHHTYSFFKFSQQLLVVVIIFTKILLIRKVANSGYQVKYVLLLFFFTKLHRHKDCMSFLSCFVILVHPVHLAWHSPWPLPCPLYELTAYITQCNGNENECPPLPRPVRKQVFVVSQYRHFCVQKWLHFFADLALQSFGFSLGSSHVYAGQVLFMSLLSSIFY